MRAAAVVRLALAIGGAAAFAVAASSLVPGNGYLVLALFAVAPAVVGVAAAWPGFRTSDALRYGLVASVTVAAVFGFRIVEVDRDVTPATAYLEGVVLAGAPALGGVLVLGAVLLAWRRHIEGAR